MRSLVNDIGAEIGCPAHVSRLVRLSSGNITLDDCSSLAELIGGKPKIMDACKVLGFPILEAGETQAADVGYGRSITIEGSSFNANELVSVKRENLLLAIYQVKETDGLSCKLRPKTVFDGRIALAN